MNAENSKKPYRTFSPEFKRKIVGEIEQGKLRPSEVSRSYNVRRSAVYNWIKQFGTARAATEHLVLEIDSDTRKAEALEKRVAELERVVGQKQLEIDLLNRLIALAEERWKVDLKKNFVSSLSSPFATSDSEGSR